MNHFPDQKCILFLLLVYSLPLWAQRVPLTIYDIDDGLPQGQVWSMVQDHKGFLWLGTYSGLTRFNGSTWDHYDTSRGLLKNSVGSLALDWKGRILIGFRSGGIQRMDGLRFEIPGSDPRLKTVHAQQFLADKSGAIYFCSVTGLYRLKDDVFTRYDEFNDKNGVYGLTRGPAGGIWFNHRETVYRLQDDVITAYRYKGLEDMEPRILHFVGDTLYLGTSQGIYRLDGDRALPVTVDGEMVGNVTHAATDGKGQPWFSTTKNGLIGLTADGPFVLDKSRGLPHPYVDRLLFDREQNLWFCGESQFGKYTPGPILAYNTDHGLPHNTARAVAESADGVVWVGTRNGVARRASGDKYFEPIDMSDFRGSWIFDIEVTQSGRILFGTDLGMTIWENGKARSLQGHAHLEKHGMQSVVEDKKGRIWCGSWWGFYRYTGDTMVKVDHPAVVRHSVVTARVVPEGLIWLGTDKGPVVFNPDTGDAWNYDERFGIIVWDLDVDRRGRIWIGTNGLGLFCYDGHSFKQYTREDGLSDNYIWQVLCTRDGDVWAGHNRGLTRFSDGRFDHFNTADGVAYNEQTATACLEDSAGNLWFGSAGGLTRYTPGNEVKLRTPPLVYIDSVHAADELVSDVSPLLPKARNSLRIRFSGVYFSDILAYSYRMEGVDSDWSRPSKLNIVTYRNLPAGPYTFRARAVTESGAWSERDATFSFVIQPAFYETAWFIGLVIVALVGFIMAYVRLRTWNIDRRRLLLQQEVKIRTRELQETNRALKKAQQQLVASAHRAGMAEVAAENIHNMGNFLTGFAVGLAKLTELATDDRQEHALKTMAERLDRPDSVEPSVVLPQLIRLLEGLHGRSLKRRTALDDALEDMRGKLGRMMELLDYQRDFTEGPDHLEQLDLNDLVRENLAIQLRAMEERNINVHFEEYPLPMILSSRFKLCNILAHLLKNAVEALGTTMPAEGRRLIIRTEPLETGIRCTVTDNGPGIDPHVQERIFSGYTTKPKAWGFGLHFCANAVRSLGGSIQVTSDGREHGAVFTLELPLRHAD
ncbi:MAG: two-component regulator propeller domain-containing protein [Acidobacteriota bacterium]|nr:two-component regulator propeller domain-containing protein [Acidobacteriota bacterium]